MEITKDQEISWLREKLTKITERRNKWQQMFLESKKVNNNLENRNKRLIKQNSSQQTMIDHLQSQLDNSSFLYRQAIQDKCNLETTVLSLAHDNAALRTIMDQSDIISGISSIQRGPR